MERLAGGAPKSDNENFVSGYRTFGRCYTIPKEIEFGEQIFHCFGEKSLTSCVFLIVICRSHPFIEQTRERFSGRLFGFLLSFMSMSKCFFENL